LQLNRAAELYVAVVRHKDALRAMGYGGLRVDAKELEDVARSYFPGADVDKAMQRIKNAARKYRKKPQP